MIGLIALGLILMGVFVWALLEEKNKERRIQKQKETDVQKKQEELEPEQAVKERLMLEKNNLSQKISLKLHIDTQEIKKIAGVDKPLLEINKRIMQILSKYLKILWTKKEQTCYQDDYGNAVDTKWVQEKRYFIQNIIFKDDILNQIQSSMDACWGYLYNKRAEINERCKTDLCKYWWNRYKDFMQWLQTQNYLGVYEQIVNSSCQGPYIGITEQYTNFLDLDEYSKICKIFPVQNMEVYLSDFAKYKKMFENYASYNSDIYDIDLWLMMLYLECSSVTEGSIERLKNTKNKLMAIYKVCKNNGIISFKYNKTSILSDLKDGEIHVPYDLMNYSEEELAEEDAEATLSELIDVALMFLDGELITTESIKNPLDYEKQIANKLKQSGFNAHATKGSGDQGADVLADKNGVKFAIQCKMYSKPVGNKAVQEANTARDFYKCDYAVVVTNAGYTKSARQAANACNVILLNENQLDKLEKYTE